MVQLVDHFVAFPAALAADQARQESFALAALLLAIGLFIWLLWELFQRTWLGAFLAGGRAHKAGRFTAAEQHLRRAMQKAQKIGPDDVRRESTLNVVCVNYVS